jgi:hypothetical protein
LQSSASSSDSKPSSPKFDHSASDETCELTIRKLDQEHNIKRLQKYCYVLVGDRRSYHFDRQRLAGWEVNVEVVQLNNNKVHIMGTCNKCNKSIRYQFIIVTAKKL